MATILTAIGEPDMTGAARMMLTFAKEFQKAGHRMLALVGPRPVENGSVIDPLREAGVEIFEEQGFRRLLDVGLIGRVADLLRREKVDLAYCSQSIDIKICTWATWKAGIPLLISGQNTVDFQGNLFLRNVKWWGYYVALLASRPHVAASSQFVADLYRDEFRLPTNRLSLVNNGIDVLKFSNGAAGARERLRAEFGVSPKTLLLLNTGRLTQQKGQDVLLRAFGRAKLPHDDVRLLLVGAADAHDNVAGRKFDEYLLEIVKEEGIADRVIFAGWRTDVADIVQAADAYVHSARWEGFPGGLTSLEAMAAGKPVVSTLCGGKPLPGFIDDRHGWYVAADDATSLSRAIERLTALNESERNTMGAACRELAVTQYDHAHCGPKFVKLAHEILDRTSTSRNQVSVA